MWSLRRRGHTQDLTRGAGTLERYRLAGVRHGQHEVARLSGTGTHCLRPPLTEEPGHGGLVCEAKFAHVLGKEKCFNAKQGMQMSSDI